MIIGLGAVALIGIAYWMLWNKMHAMEQKLFRMHDEMSLSLKSIEEQVNLTQSMIERLHEDIPPVPQEVKKIWGEREFSERYGNSI
ncbi:MAG: hypothetical protein GAK29_04471 [Acinetobacter bereziniae]|uniref:Uncharacterized protein n=1 Tax=Acinetobacter bereziniae TaxID=106648 RepID=A0A833U993_ACIBZ|nr:MAG: hypothetical protein GAK29_04471 [Acinetobacter bereziniae]